MTIAAWGPSHRCEVPAELSRPRIVARSMFLFFSNKTGCLGSLLISAGVSLVILVLLGWIQLPRW